MSLKLIKGSYRYKEPIIDMLKEWKEYNDTHDVNCSPWAIFKNSCDDFDFYLSNLETSEPKTDGFRILLSFASMNSEISWWER